MRAKEAESPLNVEYKQTNKKTIIKNGKFIKRS